MAEAVILSAIEILDCWLLKNGGIREENVEKLYSLIVGMSDLGDEKKKMVHTLLHFPKYNLSDLWEMNKKVQSSLQHFGMEKKEEEEEEDQDEDEEDKDEEDEDEEVEEDEDEEDEDEEDEEDEDEEVEEDEDEDEDEEDKEDKMETQMRLGLMCEYWTGVGEVEEGADQDEKKERGLEKMYNSLQRDLMGRNKYELFKLLDLNKEKMKRLVVGMADFWEDYKGELCHLLYRVVKKYDNYTLIDIADLWGDDEGELDRTELFYMLSAVCNGSTRKMMCRMSGEVAGLWKDKQPKLNKEKLYTWLANKMDLCEAKYLFSVLYDVVLLYDSSDFHKAMRKGVERAKRELGEILDLIRDKKLGEERSLRFFISDAVDMAHDARFLIQLQDSDPFSLFFELSILQVLDRSETNHKWFEQEFKHIVKVLREIKYGMLGSGVERLQNVREMEGGENVVGLEEDVELLVRDECNGKTTVITGMAGSGKTTLARQLYNHTTIVQRFQYRAWVCLSNSKVFSRKEMLVSLIRQLVASNKLASLEKIECADYKSLKQVLRQQLLGKPYFIVLDDVSYNTTHLEYVMKALPKGGEKRLLLTSRAANRDYEVYSKVKHKMKPMDDDKSWTLLLKTLSIEGIDEQFPKPLVKKARQTLRKCAGLPFAIKEVGRHWAEKRKLGREWEELIESIDLSETLEELESTYHTWDPQLQSRFLHLAFFKEGATISAKRLVRIWRVMGLDLDFEELVNESIIEVIATDKQENIKTCCIHAVFHMLSIRKAEVELNLEILNKDGNHPTSHQPHHRVIYCSREKLMNSSSNRDKHLVSLFFYGGGYLNASPSYWEHFQQLKTLDLEDFGLKILPDAIGMLSELRYLGLRNNYIQELPHSLSQLKKLEVLDIALNFMVEVEDTIGGMNSLHHLYMSDISCRKPLRIDTLKNLKTWTYISVHNWTYETSRLKMMKNLSTLGIEEVDGNADVGKLFSSLAQLKGLTFLILRGFRFKSMPSLDEIHILGVGILALKLEGLITRLPSANNFPLCIRYLILVNSCLHEDPMPILQKVSTLFYLRLQNAYTGQQMVISNSGFSRLKFLFIEELWHLTNLEIEKNLMRRLTRLEINNCPNLETLPE